MRKADSRKGNPGGVFEVGLEVASNTLTKLNILQSEFEQILKRNSIAETIISNRLLEMPFKRKNLRKAHIFAAKEKP